MFLKFSWCAFVFRVALFLVVVQISRQHPQNAATSQAQLATNKNLYELNIELPDNSFRHEIASLQISDNSKDLSVTGFLQLNFIKTNTIGKWAYLADKNGFAVRYKYTSATYRPTPPPYLPPPPPQSLSPNALKSAGG